MGSIGVAYKLRLAATIVLVQIPQMFLSDIRPTALPQQTTRSMSNKKLLKMGLTQQPKRSPRKRAYGAEGGQTMGNMGMSQG